MGAAQIPRTTTEREQLVKVIAAAEALVTLTADPRITTDVRDHAFRARYAAWGALNDHDETVRNRPAEQVPTDEHAAFVFCHDLVETPLPYVGWQDGKGSITVAFQTLERMADDFEWPLELAAYAGNTRVRIPGDLTWQPCSPATCTEHTEDQRDAVLAAES